jgi:hypothetical protein
MARRLEITLSDEQWDRLNAARGHERRASYVKRALESALSEAQGPIDLKQAAPGPVDRARNARSARAATPTRTSADPASARRKASIQETWAR